MTDSRAPRLEVDEPAPSVWRWYQVLCVFLAVVNAVLAALGVWIGTNLDWLVSLSENPESDRAALAQGGPVLIGTGIAFAALNLMLLTFPRKPWAYLVHLGNILAAIFLCCPAPLAIPLLIFWIRPEAREYFGMK